jgi:polyhydroxybutyrate depolymerase
MKRSPHRWRLATIAAMIFSTACWAGAAGAETIAVDGVARSFTALLPETRPAPLVIVLHGNTQTGEDMMTRTSWPAVARREHFGVVFPDGLNRAWADLRPETKRALRAPPKGTDDVAFIVKLIEKYVADGSADPRRIYVTGVSNGGAMTMTLACLRADLLAAAASVIINLTDDLANGCHPQRPVPMLLMNGTADPLVPYLGGRGTSRFAVDGFWSTERTLAFWRSVNGCEERDAAVVDLGDRDASDRSTVTRISSTCPEGRDVVLYRINDGGHRMPANFADARLPRVANYFLGPQNHDIDGAETIWAFFKRFP